MQEVVTVFEHYGNDFSRQRQAIYFGKGKVEYLPDPEPEVIEEEADSDPS